MSVDLALAKHKGFPQKRTDMGLKKADAGKEKPTEKAPLDYPYQASINKFLHLSVLAGQDLVHCLNIEES